MHRFQGAAVFFCVFFQASAATLRKPNLSIRGGSGNWIEHNPNYVPPPGSFNQQRDRGVWMEPQPTFHSFAAPPQQQPLGKQLQQYLSKLHKTSPVLYFGSLSCVAVFLLWRIPAVQPLLQKHFVCSRRNVRAGRLSSILLSAISHANLGHLLMNLMAFVTLGPAVQQALASTQSSFLPFVVGAALSGSLCFLLLRQGRNGGCMGLSGVTCSLLAMQARLYPQKVFGILFMGIFPVRIPADRLLRVALLWSLLGSVIARSNVAHAAHLGGLLFGVVYYEVWFRRCVVTRTWRQRT